MSENSIDIREYIQNTFKKNSEYIHAMLSRGIDSNMTYDEQLNAMIVNSINVSLELSVLSILDVLQKLEVIPFGTLKKQPHVDKSHLRLVWDSKHPEKTD